MKNFNHITEASKTITWDIRIIALALLAICEFEQGYELKYHIFSNIVKTYGLNRIASQIGLRSESAGSLFYLS